MARATQWEILEFDLSAGRQSISKFPIEIKGVSIGDVNTSAHAVLFQDSATVRWRLAPTATANNSYPLGIAFFETPVINPDSSATGRITVHFRRAAQT